MRRNNQSNFPRIVCFHSMDHETLSEVALPLNASGRQRWENRILALTKTVSYSDSMHASIHKAADAVLRCIRRQPFYFTRYNNTLTYTVNRRYLSYAKACTMQYAKTHGPVTLPTSRVETHAAMCIKNAFPREQAIAYSERISKMIEENDPHIHHPRNFSDLQIRVQKPLECLGTDVCNVFKSPEVHQAFLAFFRGNYRIEWVTSYRTIPSDRKASSWLWHSDSYPPFTCKLFLHLTPATGETGATEFFTKEDTMAYRRAGYFGQFLDERYDDLEDFARAHALPYRPFHCDAAPGDVTIFNMNCFHRAVAPRKGFRDIIQFFLVPNPIPWDEQFAKDGIASMDSKGGGYVNDPRRRDGPASMGMMGH